MHPTTSGLRSPGRPVRLASMLVALLSLTLVPVASAQPTGCPQAIPAQILAWGSVPPAPQRITAGEWTGLESFDDVLDAPVGLGVALDGLEGFAIQDIEVSITWTQSGGSCANPVNGLSTHDGTGFTLVAPSGASLLLVEPGTYSGLGINIATVTTVFSDSANSPHSSGTPVSGTFLPDGAGGLGLGLTSLAAAGVDGTWQLLATSTSVAGSVDPPLCVFAFSVTALVTIPQETPEPGIEPRIISLPTTATSLAAGAHHALALDCNGEVWSWGDNDFGEVGSADGFARLLPLQVAGLANIQQVATRSYHSLAVHADGTLSAWGYGDFGQLGLGTEDSHDTPQPLTSPIGVQ
ncbi:MAG TPA: hypothetical protein EYQ27_09700, partial [Gemmatimonadetes bacterium]|nr:hypothetical protein [Gemmatimonadota bacterium]